MASRRAPRLAPAMYVGMRAYSLTICCERRRPVLQDPAACALVLLHLRRTADAHRFAILAYCLMPDHAHVVAAGAERSSLLEFVRLFKQQTAFEWKRVKQERLWQASFYDHALRDAEDTRFAVRYVLRNPVRAGLVTAPADYAHSGSLVYSRPELIEWAFGTGGTFER